MTMPTTAEQMVSSDTADAFHQRIKLAYDLTVADCDDHDQAMLRASVAAATFAMSSAEAARYARRQLPQSGGYACDDDGIIPADTVRTIAETDYNHEQAMNAIASLLRSHEVLRTRADAAERRVEALTSLVAVMEQMAAQAYEHWDADRDAKVGKILGALASHRPGYSITLDAARQAVTEADAALAAASGAADGAATTEG